MEIAGLVPSSLIDYPGKAAAVVFLPGCNYRCGYCHNRSVVLYEAGASAMAGEAFFAFLERRRRFLDAVCVSGGEPTLHPDLPVFLEAIRAAGYEVKLDTNGSRPDMLRTVLERGLADYVAMDVKGPPSKYPAIAGRDADPGPVAESARLLADAWEAGRIGLEFRTTVCREQLALEDLQAVRNWIPDRVPWHLQAYRSTEERLDRSTAFSAYPEEEMREMGRILCASAR